MNTHFLSARFYTQHKLRKFLISLILLSVNLLTIAHTKATDNNKQYNGENLSLNSQDIEVRSVLQIIADFTNTNIVVSDEVQGNITLHLKDVPWQQALDVILKSKGLSMVKRNNVIFIAPSQIIMQQKKDAYEIANIEDELAPLEQVLIPIRYARAEQLKATIDNNDAKSDKGGILSSRGYLSVDTRTNTLVVNDVPNSIAKVQRIVKKLDVAVRQVLIDARIVSVSNNFSHELGIRWGGSAVGKHGGISGTMAGIGENSSINNRLGVNLGTTATPYGTLGVKILNADFLLDLELSALEDEGQGEVISRPHVMAQDGHRATIKSGTELAYTTHNDKGTAKVMFKDVNLSLDVIPKITPNHMVDMILKVDRDTVGALTQTLDGVIPSINTNGVETRVLVASGNTVVLGSIYEHTETKSVAKVPVLGDLPVIGRAFRRDKKNVTKTELLIFITPKIINDNQLVKSKNKTALY